MTEIEKLDKIAISVRSHRLLGQLLKENPTLETILQQSRNETEALVGVKNWILTDYKSHPAGKNLTISTGSIMPLYGYWITSNLPVMNIPI
jgi:lysine 2,3-aminomutase